MTGVQLELDYQSTVPVCHQGETMIQRVPANKRLGQVLADWKRLREHGWDVTALLAHDQKTVVLLACR